MNLLVTGLQIAVDALLIDVSIFSVLTIVSYLANRAPLPLETSFAKHLLTKHKRLVVWLFPWIPLLVWLSRQGRKHQSVTRMVCWFVLVFCIGGQIYFYQTKNPQASAVGALFAVFQAWTFIVIWSLLGPDDDRRGNDPDEQPDDPTPTGDVVDFWLRSLTRSAVR